MKDQKKKAAGLLFVVSAPSGAGKTTLCQEVAVTALNLRHSVSHTTREPRPGEITGQHYYFVSQPEFQEMIDSKAFLEWAEVHGHFYGTSFKALEALWGRGLDIILDIDYQGAAQLREKKIEGVFIYILPPSFEALKSRLKERKSESPAEISRRLSKSREEITSYRDYHYLIVNDDFEKAKKELMTIISAERMKIQWQDLSWVDKEFLGGS